MGSTPALENGRVPPPGGPSAEPRTRRCGLISKKRRKDSRISLPLQNFPLVSFPVILLVTFPVVFIIPCPYRACRPQHRTNFHGRSIAETPASSNLASS